MMQWMSVKKMVLVVLVAALSVPQMAFAHCDALDGPVLKEAQQALAKKDVSSILKWVPAEEEAAITSAFKQTVAVRGLGEEARDLADRSFFETLVRIHRAGEGAAYTGIKPSGQISGPVAKADQALVDGDVDAFSKAVADHVAKEMKSRFERALAKQKQAHTSVAAGREYVAAYVAYVHFVEGIVGIVRGDHAH
ncbi:DUF6448 family protein [Chrysiogenes arsenatis]|uniref:DUF6448 family protein n=1 Tax=Chrysiogenes arsenatis TaxID=309797 RepID=UPI000403E21E|nr:DUF6448 family protein [Chrysiogenes arsenatis]